MQKHYRTNYLKDGRLEIFNSWEEESIMPFVMDRKNSMFPNNAKAATGSDVVFSLIQIALTDFEIVQQLLLWNAVADCETK